MAFFGNAPTGVGVGVGATSTPAKQTGFGNFSFGNQPTSTAPAFGNTQAPPFGSAFGTSSTPALTGFSAFGTNTTTTQAAFGGFGTGTTSTAPLASSAFSGFGTAATAPTGAGAFGAPFGSTFAKPVTAATPAFGGFGASGFGQQTAPAPLFGQPQQQQQPQINSDEIFAQAIFHVSIYGDERDNIIAKWNYLQALWGTGKAFYTIQAQPPVEITPQNYLCRFKTMGYSRLPGKENKLGHVALNFNKKYEEILPQKDQIIQNLTQIFGNKPNLQIIVDSIKPVEEKSLVIIYVQEKSQQLPNETKRILATETSNFLNQANIKQQLTNLGIEKILALVLPDEDQLKEYLEKPPQGIDPRMWKQAKTDNPDSKKFIPVPMIGFNDLKWRIKCQENETEVHTQFLNKLERDLAELKQRHAASTAKIMEHRRKLAELSHKILKIVVKQECTRKVGMPLSPEEEILRSKLENMQALVSAPTQFKGRLSELLSQMRMQRNQYSTAAMNEYTLDRDSEEDMKTFLTMQQNAMKILINTVNKDLKALNIITEGMNQLIRS